MFYLQGFQINYSDSPDIFYNSYPKKEKAYSPINNHKIGLATTDLNNYKTTENWSIKPIISTTSRAKILRNKKNKKVKNIKKLTLPPGGYSVKP